MKETYWIPHDLPEATEKLIRSLGGRPGGSLVLRWNEDPPGSFVHDVSRAELEPLEPHFVHLRLVQHEGPELEVL